MTKLLNSALEELNYCIKYLNEEYPNRFRYSPKLTPFSMKDMMFNNPNQLNTTKDNHLMNRPIGWRPKARKSFPTPTNSSYKTEETRNGFPLKTSNDIKNSKQNIEIIEFTSDRLPNKRAAEDSDHCFDKRLKIEDNIESQTNSETFEYMSQQISSNIKVVTVEPIKNMINSESKPKEVNLKDVEIEAKNEEIANNDTNSDPHKIVKCLQTRVKGLEKAMEIKDNNYRKQIMEMQQKSDLAFEQMRRSLEIDKQRAVIEEQNKQIAINSENLNKINSDFETEKNQLIEKHKLEIKCLEENFNKEIKSIKTKIWCFSCLKEAQLYCCSHTYYCSNECQLNHWEVHKQICTQK